jgi:hypothetical protein
LTGDILAQVPDFPGGSVFFAAGFPNACFVDDLDFGFACSLLLREAEGTRSFSHVDDILFPVFSTLVFATMPAPLECVVRLRGQHGNVYVYH